MRGDNSASVYRLHRSSLSSCSVFLFVSSRSGWPSGASSRTRAGLQYDCRYGGAVPSTERMPECGSSRSSQVSPRSATHSVWASNSSPSRTNATIQPAARQKAADHPQRPSRRRDRQRRNRPAGARPLQSGEAIYELDVELLTQLEPDLILTQELCPVCAVSYEDVLQDRTHAATLAKVLSVEPTCVEGVLDSIHHRRHGGGRERVAAGSRSGTAPSVDWIGRRIGDVAGAPPAASSASNGSIR